eukprot:CAMPEP_0202363970 /NCGR_PEP_ID=MMETSP1126-20121109/15551_1 /ASSEMBLY_ACC=CAM_ASM_000457 /TAXON_ID=3047 /ORGANISM="Dunaliella tertiolecta, Strain CCMP1320" /LENGTH=120 /DNA_ID=CAMNT_0048958491 /DNA_START=1098 /DNA_END=1460 /DNA_ORIENTATION=-
MPYTLAQDDCPILSALAAAWGITVAAAAISAATAALIFRLAAATAAVALVTAARALCWICGFTSSQQRHPRAFDARVVGPGPPCTRLAGPLMLIALSPCSLTAVLLCKGTVIGFLRAAGR